MKVSSSQGTIRSVQLISTFSRCPSLTHIRCSDGLICIRKSWMCDGKMDCPDQSDEIPHICHKRPSFNSLQLKHISIGLRCPPTWFRCADSMNCVAPDRVCDKYKDCRYLSYLPDKSLVFLIQGWKRRTRELQRACGQYDCRLLNESMSSYVVS